MKKINIILQIILMCNITVMCNGQNDKIIKTNNTIEKKEKLPNFFDKKYFHGYQLDANSQFPIFNHTDLSIGSFTISFINKDIEKQKEWINFDFKNKLFAEDNPDDKYFNDLNEIIKNKLEPNLNNYQIIAEYIPVKYVDENMDFIYPYIRTYYLYNNKSKIWNYIKQKTISDGANEKNITKLSELNNLLNIKESKTDNQSNINSTDIALENINGSWSLNCGKKEYRNDLFIDSNYVQFSIFNRFSMNAELKKVDTNKYEFYFTDFPPIIPLPDNMQVWENMDEKKPVGTIEIISESKLILTWFGFYHKKLKKNIETENPFDNLKAVAELIKCNKL